MKKRLDPQYMKIIFYVSLGTVIISLLGVVVFNLIPILSWLWEFLMWIIGILTPLIWGIIIAYLVEPLEERIESKLKTIKVTKKLVLRRKNKKKKKKKGQPLVRVVSTILASMIVLAIVGGCLYGFFVTIRITSSDLIVNRTVIGERIMDELDDFLGAVEAGIQSLKTKVELKEEFLGWIEYIKEQVYKFISYLPDTFTQIIYVLINLFFAFIFAFNLIISKEYFMKLLSNFIKYVTTERTEIYIKDLGRDIDKVVKNYIIGYSLDLTLISFATAIALWIAGFPYPFIIGIFAGATNIIPYLGSWLGALPIVFVCLLEGGLRRGIFGYFYILIIQQLYYSFVTPRIQGEFVGIHPLFVLLAFIVFGHLFGFIGMILAVPLAGIAGVIIVRVIRVYKRKRLDYMVHKEKNE